MAVYDKGEKSEEGFKVKIGRCPKCNSENLDYGDVIPESGAIYYPWECGRCKSTGKEWYNLTL